MFHGRKEPESATGGYGGQRSDRPSVERFEAVVLPHLDAMYRLARTLAASEAEAEDLVQETCVRAFQGFDGFELRSYGAKPWLFRILYNTFYTLKGKQRREPGLLDGVSPDHLVEESHASADSSHIVDELNWEHFDQEIKAAVAQLRPEYRVVLLLWSIEGLSYKEISAVCGCALGTVMSRLYRARRAIALQLRDYARERQWPMERFE